MGPDDIEIRAVACLVEKQRTTPDAYPLTLNSLRLACNQSTNRDPVVDYDESTVRAAANRLTERGWATLASWSNRRSMKYRHTLDRALGLSDAELAVLTVLMLRGPQTPGELKQRAERMHPFASLDEVETTLRSLTGRELVAQLPRRPGQREDRFRHLLGEEQQLGADSAQPAQEPEPGTASEPDTASEPERDDRLARLEAEVASLRRELDALKQGA
ncbi:MAG TPA: YceH family protein [Thermoleophilaceae bacterium]|nr:YceH family protein [Thermoleophilaceae bacterium]